MILTKAFYAFAAVTLTAQLALAGSYPRSLHVEVRNPTFEALTEACQEYSANEPIPTLIEDFLPDSFFKSIKKRSLDGDFVNLATFGTTGRISGIPKSHYRFPNAMYAKVDKCSPPNDPKPDMNQPMWRFIYPLCRDMPWRAFHILCGADDYDIRLRSAGQYQRWTYGNVGRTAKCKLQHPPTPIPSNNWKELPLGRTTFVEREISFEFTCPCATGGPLAWNGGGFSMRCKFCDGGRKVRSPDSLGLHDKNG